MDMYQKRKARQEKNVNKVEDTSKTNINWYPGHMAKTKRQIMEDIKLIDVVVEILDARLPLASQNPDVKEMIGNKKKIIVLNKCDLADDAENRKWKQYFEKNNIPVVLTEANSGKGIHEVISTIQKVMSYDLIQSSEKGRVGKSIRVLVLGIPNVGKSSFINRIAARNTAKVGNKPGVTKQKQWIKVANNIELLDTPGVLWPKFQNEKIALNLSYVGTIKDDLLEKIDISFYLFKYLLENYKINLMERYKITENQIIEIMSQDRMENENIFELMYLAGKNRGAIGSGGSIDEEKLANIILDDFRSGKLGKISLEKVGE